MTGYVRAGIKRPRTIHAVDCPAIPPLALVEPWPHPGVPEQAVAAHIAAAPGLRGYHQCMPPATHKPRRASA